MSKLSDWLMKRWMLLGVSLARRLPFLHRAKMKIGDSMVLACTLTLPRMLDGSDWPEGRSPLLVMFRPPKGASGGELFESEADSTGRIPSKSSFTRVETTAIPLYGALAYVFVTDNYDRPRRYFVRCSAGDHLVDSGIVVSKIDQGPTAFVDDFVRVHGDNAPTFEWPEPRDTGHWIHFLVVSTGGELLSGIYIRKCQWIYGVLGDLPYYIHDPVNTPPIQPGLTYDLMYHAVDTDGWVTLCCMRSFRTGTNPSVERIVRRT